MPVIAVEAGILALLLIFVLGVPEILSRITRGRMADTLARAERIHLAMEQMALDASTSGDKRLGWPADAGMKNVAELKALLIEKGYMNAEDAEKLRFEDFQVGNVSRSDPDDTVVLRSSPDKRAVIIFQKDGDAAIPRLRPRTPRLGNDPPREPAYLSAK